MTTTINSELMIKCGTHGSQTPAVVCCHMIQMKERVVGFVENNDDPNDLQAWCEACEQLFVREGEMIAEFRKFNDMTIICDFCYAQLKEKHSQPSSPP